MEVKHVVVIDKQGSRYNPTYICIDDQREYRLNRDNMLRAIKNKRVSNAKIVQYSNGQQHIIVDYKYHGKLGLRDISTLCNIREIGDRKLLVQVQEKSGFELRIPIQITDVAPGCLSGASYTNVVIENSRDKDIRLDGLCKEMTSEVLWIYFSHPEKVTSIKYLFKDCKNLKEVHIPQFYELAATDLTGLLSGCIRLSYIDFGELRKHRNRKKITSLCRTFEQCINLKDIQFLYFQDLSKCAQMHKAFSMCTQLRYQDLKWFESESLEDMQMAFQGCVNLISVQDSSNKNVYFPQLKTMEMCFLNCQKLEGFFLQRVRAPKLDNIQYILCGCSSLKQSDIGYLESNRFSNKTGVMKDTPLYYMMKAAGLLKGFDD